MAEQVTVPKAEDVLSVGTRISWGAVFAGALLALALHFLFGILGAAVGVSVSDRVEPENLRTGALLWAIFVTCVSLFVGGMVVSQFTVGENKMEAMLYGIIMWALLFAMLLGLGAIGVRAGQSTMVGMATYSQASAAGGWEVAAERAGFPAEQIAAWRKQRAEATAGKTAPTPTEAQAAHDAAVTKIAWYTFAGTWISMLAAAAGALVGAGPTFRLVTVPGPGVIRTTV